MTIHAPTMPMSSSIDRKSVPITTGSSSGNSSVSSGDVDPVDNGSCVSPAMSPSFAGPARDGGLPLRLPAVDRADHEVEHADEEGERDGGDAQAHGPDLAGEQLVQRRPEVGEQRNGQHEVDAEAYREPAGAGFLA